MTTATKISITAEEFSYALYYASEKSPENPLKATENYQNNTSESGDIEICAKYKSDALVRFEEGAQINSFIATDTDSNGYDELYFKVNQGFGSGTEYFAVDLTPNSDVSNLEWKSFDVLIDIPYDVDVYWNDGCHGKDLGSVPNDFYRLVNMDGALLFSYYDDGVVPQSLEGSYALNEYGVYSLYRRDDDKIWSIQVGNLSTEKLLLCALEQEEIPLETRTEISSALWYARALEDQSSSEQTLDLPYFNEVMVLPLANHLEVSVTSVMHGSQGRALRFDITDNNDSGLTMLNFILTPDGVLAQTASSGKAAVPDDIRLNIIEAFQASDSEDLQNIAEILSGPLEEPVEFID